MKLSPLQVQHYHFTELTIKARSDIDAEAIEYDHSPYPRMDTEPLSVDVSMGELDGDLDPHQFVILLNISYVPNAGSSFPYQFYTALEGVFSFDHSGDLVERKKLVVCNGASMLYGVAREQILTLTARHKFGPILLPTANFNGLNQSDESEERTIHTPEPRVTRKNKTLKKK